ncbi:ABC transporter permease [Lichenifustis flavocetrariae]|uniref:ABC transporter permease n=1 Tax=Lichenifustis flavocetrariae TaxID=2949735 RepID=A0AA41YVL4_9HYPH|nr:ABC transporter permease [Lichenifustis flavocetrariae]MCW6508919.1 ABC transporter permease [Lichenifustis flavocetrariae]
MPRILGRRLLSAAVTLFGASLAVFAVLDVLPGNAAAILLGTAARPDTMAAMAHQLGLDRPAYLRYGSWIAGAVSGDLGYSAAYGVPVRGLILERLAVTLPLAAIALTLAVSIGVTLGVLAAGRAHRWPDRAASTAAQLGMAVPDFWIGIMLILVFSTTLRWFSAGGFGGWDDPAAGVRSLLLPAVALALPQAAVLSRVTRAAVLEVLTEDFIRTARAKGVSAGRVLWRHALPVAIMPVLTIVGLQVSFLIAGAVLVETVFNLPGLGRLAYQALAQRDLVVMRSVAFLFAALVIGVNMLVDLAQPWLDPRLRRG